jgi:hypothetical protein
MLLIIGAPLQPECLCFRPALNEKRNTRLEMLWITSVILFVLWLLGVATSYTFGGFINILLVLAVVIVLIRFFPRRRIIS